MRKCTPEIERTRSFTTSSWHRDSASFLREILAQCASPQCPRPFPNGQVFTSGSIEGAGCTAKNGARATGTKGKITKSTSRSHRDPQLGHTAYTKRPPGNVCSASATVNLRLLSCMTPRHMPTGPLPSSCQCVQLAIEWKLK